MKISCWEILNKRERENLLKRPLLEELESERVLKIMRDIEKRGAKALLEYSQRFDAWSVADLMQLRGSKTDLLDAEKQLQPELKDAIGLAALRIEKFHAHQGLTPYNEQDEIECQRRIKAIERVGLYIPAGSAPLFSTVLMLAIPAKLAGVKEIVLCTPRPFGQPSHAAILYAAQLCGVQELYYLGGVQAISALAYGGGLLQPVDKICGPGNSYVTIAKRLLSLERPQVAIDLPAGPSELCVVADKGAKADFLAADLLSQAEHDTHAQTVLISDHAKLLEDVIKALQEQLKVLPRGDIAKQALQHSRIILASNLMQAMTIANVYAAEHLSLAVSENFQHSLLEQVKHAGSVFLGYLSAEAFGDYLSGTNHVLPTHGCARSYSGVTVESFQRSFTVQKVTPASFPKLAQATIKLAETEGLEAHAKAVKLRLENCCFIQ